MRLVVSVAQYEEAFWSTRAGLSHFLVESPVAIRDIRVEFLDRPAAALKLAPTIASRHPSRSLMAVSFEYLQSMQGRSLTLGFDFGQSWDYALRQIPASSMTLSLVPDNGHCAELYSSTVYARQQKLEDFLGALSVIAVLLLALGFCLGCKRIASEMLVVFQTAYFGLLPLSALTPLFAALTALARSTNGHNLLYSSQLRPFDDSLASSSLKAMGLYSQFLFNLNAGALPVLLAILVGLVLLALAKAARFE